MSSQSAWSLHPQLARDTVPLGDLALSRVLAMNDANYPWLVLVPRRPDVVEIIDLDAPARTDLMAETARVCGAQGPHAVRQAQRRGDRQCGAAVACPHRGAAQGRPRLAAPGVGRGAGSSLCGRRYGSVHRRIAHVLRTWLKHRIAPRQVAPSSPPCDFHRAGAYPFPRDRNTLQCSSFGACSCRRTGFHFAGTCVYRRPACLSAPISGQNRTSDTPQA